MDPFDLRLWEDFGEAGGDLSVPAFIERITVDSRRIDSGNTLFVALKGENEDGHIYLTEAVRAGCKFALVSKERVLPDCGTSIKLLRVANPLRAFQKIVKAYRLTLPTKIIGITGSFGKTMVKDLLHMLLGTSMRTAASPESFNSQIGVPLSILSVRKEHEIAVIEAAISEKDEMDYLTDIIQPDHTILTPLGNKHLSTLEDLPTLARETMKLVSATPASGWSLLPNSVLLNPHIKEIHCPHYFWDGNYPSLPHAYTSGYDFSSPAPYQICFPNQDFFNGQIKSGYSYFLNLINMASKAAWLMQIPSQKIKEVLTDYWPESMRAEIWQSPMGATFINDTYCSDPQSIIQALRHFNHVTQDQKKVFVFGGMKGHSNLLETDYKHIGKTLHKVSVDRLILFGEQSFTPLLNELNKKDPHTEITVCKDSAEALEYLKLNIHQNDLVLVKGERKISLDLLTETFNESLNNNQCLINFAAIKSNISALRKRLSSPTRMMIMVKALAYGTNDVRISKFLESCGVDILGVSYVDEGVALKRAGVKQAIFSLNAAIYEAAKAVKWDLEVGVSDCELIQALSEQAAKQNKRVKVHLHVDTGMRRFGCRPENATELAELIKKDPNLELEGIMTHFVSADNPAEDAFSESQIKSFNQVIFELKTRGITAKWVHAGNSAAAMRFQLPEYNMVRIGLAAYGLYPSEATKKNLNLRLAISLTSRIVGINLCKKGETVSYGRVYTVEKDIQKIAVLPIGYFDGFHRNYSGTSSVLIRGMKAPMIGKICMDYMMVDVTDIKNVSVGDRVLVFGEDEFGQYLSPEELAESGNSIIHELITCLGPRIQRVFVHEESHQIR
jgi:alanine racemase